jgi:hypothetical protein
MPWAVIPLLCSSFGWCLLLNVHLFEVPRLALSLVWFFLTTCVLHYATPVRRVIFLTAVASFFWDPRFPRVLSSGWLWLHASPSATSSVLLKVSLCVLGTSWCTTSDCIPSGLASESMATIVPRQAIVLSWCAVRWPFWHDTGSKAMTTRHGCRT